MHTYILYKCTAHTHTHTHTHTQTHPHTDAPSHTHTYAHTHACVTGSVHTCTPTYIRRVLGILFLAAENALPRASIPCRLVAGWSLKIGRISRRVYMYIYILFYICLVAWSQDVFSLALFCFDLCLTITRAHLRRATCARVTCTARPVEQVAPSTCTEQVA